MNGILTRFFTSLIILLIFLAIFLSSFFPIIFEIAISILIIICIYEGINATGFSKKKRYLIPSILYGGFMPLIFEIKTYIMPEKSAYYGIIILSFLYLLLILTIAMFESASMKFTDATTIMFISVSISCFLTNIIFIRHINSHGFFYMILIIVCGAWVTDIFAYLTGMLFGKHRFAPLISPKKTIEGAIGGTVFSILFTLLFCLYYSNTTNVKFNWLFVFIYATLSTIIGQLGDLAFSYIKRSYNIKDFGRILPGHGGVLDRLDSLIFIVPLFYMLLKFKDIIIR